MSNVSKRAGIFLFPGGHAGLFFKGRNKKDTTARLTPPRLLNTTSEQAERMGVTGTDFLWGCPQMNCKANPPSNEKRQGFATFKKETRMAQYLPVLFENLRM